MTGKAVQTEPRKEKPLNLQGVIYGAPEGQDARVLADRARALMPADRVLVHIALDDTRTATLQALLAFFAPDVKVVVFPAWDCLPYDRVSPNGDIVARRVSALAAMLAWEKEQRRYPRIVLTTVNAGLQRVMPRAALEKARLEVSVGQKLDINHLQTFLAENGYARSQTVREAGEYAIRGDIVDLFPPGHAEPVRIDLFGEDIETIRTFDPSSQLTQGKLDGFALQPATEFFLNAGSIERFRAGYRAAFGTIKADDPLYAAVSEGRRYNGMDHWLPLFHEKLDTLFDYVPVAAVTMDQHVPESHGERLAQIGDFYEARQTLKKSAYAKKKKAEDVSLSGAVYHPLPVEKLYLSENEWNLLIKNSQIFSPFASPHPNPLPIEEGEGETLAKKGRNFSDIRALPDGDVFAELSKHISSLQRPVMIACYSEGSRERMKGLMESAAIGGITPCEVFENLKKLHVGQVGLCILPLDHGFVAGDLAVITEQDILGDRLVRKSGGHKKAENFLREVSSLADGDLVVHIDHGIGRFAALETVQAASTLHDCLKIEYAGGDKLFVPVENIEVLSRFGADEGAVQLDKLGGAGWQARKAKAKKDLMAMADHLLAIAAARQLRKAERLDIPHGLYNEFAAKFPYQETEDQERAINDVIGDLTKEHPMDRLVCGDVGFGKTEVALRAAYVAAMHGSQVAVVVPTTLLARQHYQNFVRRFAGTGLRVEQLSRLVSAKDKKSIAQGLANGGVNIVIGTHALFAKEIRFAHLGLLIVDEEQRFGVKQKERLKEIKSNIHVLTLTATPIPRTLQMALTGVREMSLIASPPVDRLAIRTFILPFDPMVVREAILREHYRGGQTFYVCPRIKDMADVERELRELVPEVKIITAHGQLSPAELEDRMSAFYDGQYDVLLATNIIESGIDIPTANTMIVHRADMFGLAQLYQIRGRIGRSKVRAYAYLTYPPAQKLNPQAQKRLEVMETLDTLGSGFQLASHDMDIRGAGNLLGDQQSGHIREIGVELYQQMLEEAVAAARNGDGVNFTPSPMERWSPQINVGTSVLIPETYVEDLSTRMSLYRRLADLHFDPPSHGEGAGGGGSVQNVSTVNPHLDPPPQGGGNFGVEAFAAELIDRFGPIPPEVKNLLDIVTIKQFCRKAGVGSVEAGPKGAVIGFYKDSPPNVEKLMRWITEKRGAIKLRPDQKLVVIREWHSDDARVQGVRNIIKELALLSS